MIHTTNKSGERTDFESAIYLVRDAPTDLVFRLSAPERLVARSIRQRLEVEE